MKPTELLTEEHKVIKRAIRLLQEADRRLQEGDDSVIDIYPQLIDFIRHFADECHHGKEEDILFRLLERRGMPREMSPLGVMMTEHEHGRTFVRNIDEATHRFLEGDKSARENVAKNAEGYAGLLKSHIEKEDGILYPMADNMLTEADQNELLVRFDKVEDELGRDRHVHYEQLITDLEKKFTASG